MPAAQDLDRGRRRLRPADCLDCVMNAAAGQLDHLVRGGIAARIDDMRRAQLGREVALLGHRIDRDDLACARDPRRVDGGQPDAATADDAHRLAGTTRAALKIAPAPVVTAQPRIAARSSGISGSIATQACSWTSIISA